MSTHLLPMREDFNALGAEHCNQTIEQMSYRLEPLDASQLGGRKTRRKMQKKNGGKIRRKTRRKMQKNGEKIRRKTHIKTKTLRKIQRKTCRKKK
jgi:hypothetical protein